MCELSTHGHPELVHWWAGQISPSIFLNLTTHWPRCIGRHACCNHRTAATPFAFATPQNLALAHQPLRRRRRPSPVHSKFTPMANRRRYHSLLVTHPSTFLPLLSALLLCHCSPYCLPCRSVRARSPRAFLAWHPSLRYDCSENPNRLPRCYLPVCPLSQLNRSKVGFKPWELQRSRPLLKLPLPFRVPVCLHSHVGQQLVQFPLPATSWPGVQRRQSSASREPSQSWASSKKSRQRVSRSPKRSV